MKILQVLLESFLFFDLIYHVRRLLLNITLCSLIPLHILTVLVGQYNILQLYSDRETIDYNVAKGTKSHSTPTINFFTKGNYLSITAKSSPSPAVLFSAPDDPKCEFIFLISDGSRTHTPKALKFTRYLPRDPPAA